ncbi:MAG TPA: hypothetical protein K8V90_08635 [Romboutsia timonensis]|uniref:Uncharacterized protein n=1 Tax=Romboutsia timonensis TaxID=1776391 RepID=A0A921SZW4_9FIRM|nr:hypothetical protein [Romboutsia timonensis]
MVLTGAHYIYILFMVAALVTMIMKKESVVPCILGIFTLGLYYNRSLVGALGSVFTALGVALNELGSVIIIIGIMVALSKALEESKSIDFMVGPISKIVKNPTGAFFISGIFMLLMSWFFWPSPATALVGAIFLPIAIKAGLPAIGLAMAINLFGHGIALSTDFIIQGAPSITSGSAGIGVNEIISEGMILYIVMSVVTIGVAFYMLRKDLKSGELKNEIVKTNDVEVKDVSLRAKISIGLVIIAFIADIIAMYKFNLKGGDATGLLGATALGLIIIINFMNNPKTTLDKVTNQLVEGFVFGIKIFAVIIPIAAFFYMGDMSLVTVFGDVLTEGSQGILGDIGLALSQAVPFNKVAAACIETIVGGITGLDGSSFSGMSLAGSTASVFGVAINAKVGTLAALGQIAATWVGGGCIVPWALAPAAAICGVKPAELAKRNFIPVMVGLVVTTIVAIFII